MFLDQDKTTNVQLLTGLIAQGIYANPVLLETFLEGRRSVTPAIQAVIAETAFYQAVEIIKRINHQPSPK